MLKQSSLRSETAPVDYLCRPRIARRCVWEEVLSYDVGPDLFGAVREALSEHEEVGPRIV